MISYPIEAALQQQRHGVALPLSLLATDQRQNAGELAALKVANRSVCRKKNRKFSLIKKLPALCERGSRHSALGKKYNRISKKFFAPVIEYIRKK